MDSNNKGQKKKPEMKSGKGNPKDKMPRQKFNLMWLYGIIGIFLIGLYMTNSVPTIQDMSYGKLMNSAMLTDGDVDKIIVYTNKNEAEIYLRKDAVSKYLKNKENDPGPHYLVKVGSIDKFVEGIQEAQADLTKDQKVLMDFDERNDYMGSFLINFLPFILLIGIWIFIMRRMATQSGGGAGGIFSVGKSKAKLFDKEANIKVNFNDVAGLEEAKTEIEEIVSFLKSPEKYTELGGKIPKGALLVGPPGTGKTLLAKAVAGEANVPFFSLSGSDFVEMFVGVGASRVRDLFKQAKEKAPCIVFIDEIDAIGRARGRTPNMGSNDERENTLNQLLTEMDGFETNSGVIILAATNRADVLDSALMRAGRFDRQIHVELPDLNERRDIFKVHLRPLKIDESVDSEFLSKQTPGFSGADIANVCNEAALIAARKTKKFIGKQDFLDAVDRIIGGLEKKNKLITVDEKRSIAYHEAGHATVSWLLEHAHPLVKVTIVPRGKALGAAWYLPQERQLSTTEQMLDEMCATLGGRAAEDVVFGKISSGALNDLERVTKSAYAMVSYLGMSKEVGNLSYYDSSGGEYAFTKPYSERTAEVMDKEVKTMVEAQYIRAKQILMDNAENHKKLAERLLEKEVIFTEDMEEIFGKRPWAKQEFEFTPVKEAEPKKKRAITRRKKVKEEDGEAKETAALKATPKQSVKKTTEKTADKKKAATDKSGKEKKADA